MIKPLLIINDPYAGAKNNVMPLIETRFEEVQVAFNVRTTDGGLMEAFKIAQEANLDEISVMCVAGDDNTF